MFVVDIRRRTGYLFLAVIVGHVILISTQVTTKKGVPMLEAAVFGVFSEVQRGANTVTSGVQTRWQNYFALQQVRSARVSSAPRLPLGFTSSSEASRMRMAAAASPGPICV